MVQAQENLTQLSGRVLSWRPHPSREGWVLLELQLESSEPVPGKADMLSARLAGTQPCQLLLRRDLLESVQLPPAQRGVSPPYTSWRLRCRAKATPDGAQVESHPEPQDFVLEPP